FSMHVLEGGTGVLIQSDEIDIINHLRESERLRLRRAKIEEIRAKMREAMEREGAGQDEKEEGESDTKGEEGAEQNDENKKSAFLTMMGDAAAAFASGCKNASGVFRQMNKKGKPIFEHISGGKMGMRQINMKGKKAIFKPQKGVTSSVANGVGTACLIAAVAMDAIEIGTAIKQDYEGGTMHNTVHTSSGVAGGWAGAVPCAMYGASVGSIVPGAGSLIGGIVGGVIGNIGGGFLARRVAETVMPAPDEKKEPEEFVEVEYPGQCVVCRKKLDSFDLFYSHFVETHPDELLTLFSAVVSRAGEERMDIEDTWFVSKAFVSMEDKVEAWGMEDILDFNDRILVRLGWNEEEEKEVNWTTNVEKEEDHHDEWETNEKKERWEVKEVEEEPEPHFRKSGPNVIEEQQRLGGLLSVL
ncbi:hypothetical protein PENTCL1PPCAC_812, partial [Pristionchus entomophagus]